MKFWKKRVILNKHRIKQIEESLIHCCYVNLLSKRGRLGLSLKLHMLKFTFLTLRS